MHVMAQEELKKIKDVDLRSNYYICIFDVHHLLKMLINVCIVTSVLFLVVSQGSACIL